MKALLVAACALSVIAATACSTTSVRPADTQQHADPTPSDALEASYRARALGLAEEHRWSEAAVQWELLALLRPGTKDYRTQADAALRRGAEAAAAHVRAAEDARKRGNHDAATTSYLRALAADPTNAAAVTGLKALEVERARRAWLDRSPRVPYSPAVQPPSDAAAEEPQARR